MKLGMAIDSGRCRSCFNCYIACKDEHCGFDTALSAPKPDMGQFWMNILEWDRGDNSRKMKTATVPVCCVHCEEPACMAAAKDGAVYKRPDGVVIVDHVKSKGQRAIVDACPVKAVFWNEELGIPQKCTFCAELIDKGWDMPRCVQSCPNKALIFGDLDDPESEVSIKIAQGKVTPLEGMEGAKSNVVHLNIPGIFLAGTVYLPGDEVAIGAAVTAKDTESGDVLSTETNYFGDWEFEDLPKGRKMEISITMSGYSPVVYTAETDVDHYVADTYLE